MQQDTQLWNKLQWCCLKCQEFWAEMTASAKKENFQQVASTSAVCIFWKREHLMFCRHSLCGLKHLRPHGKQTRLDRDKVSTGGNDMMLLSISLQNDRLLDPWWWLRSRGVFLPDWAFPHQRQTDFVTRRLSASVKLLLQKNVFVEMHSFVTWTCFAYWLLPCVPHPFWFFDLKWPNDADNKGIGLSFSGRQFAVSLQNWDLCVMFPTGQ